MRFQASLAKTTNRPSGEMIPHPLSRYPSAPEELTLTRVVSCATSILVPAGTANETITVANRVTQRIARSPDDAPTVRTSRRELEQSAGDLSVPPGRSEPSAQYPRCRSVVLGLKPHSLKSGFTSSPAAC